MYSMRDGSGDPLMTTKRIEDRQRHARVPGVSDVSVSVTAGTMTIQHDQGQGSALS